MASLKWISIKEEFPPRCQDVLVCSSSTDYLPSVVAHYDEYDDAFYSPLDGITLTRKQVTHWMPFPSFEDAYE